jgi:hypothetical protein
MAKGQITKPKNANQCQKVRFVNFVTYCCILWFCSLPLRSFICIFRVRVLHFGRFAVGPGLSGQMQILSLGCLVLLGFHRGPPVGVPLRGTCTVLRHVARIVQPCPVPLRPPSRVPDCISRQVSVKLASLAAIGHWPLPGLAGGAR